MSKRLFGYLAALLVFPALANSPASTTGPAPAAALAPNDRDEYANLVRKAESGEAVDFLALRRAYPKSAAFLRAGPAADRLGAWREQMFDAMRRGDAKAVRENARNILAVIYIDLDAQKALQQSCKALGDDACATHHHDVEFGLLGSIIASGDGKTCATGWKVVTVDEEYFILRMLDFELERQTGPGSEGMCDTMAGTRQGKPATYYFDVARVFEGYERSFK
jgi:hypothetical protein